MKILETIHQLSLKEKKNLLERMIKLQEECGELAREVLIARAAPGTQRKKAQKKGIEKEAVDVILVALSVYFHQGNSLSDLEKALKSKAAKWQKQSAG